MLTMSKYTMQSTVSSLPPRQICTHFRLFCSPPPRESRVSGYSWRSQLISTVYNGASATVSEQTVQERTVETTPVIWDAIALFMTALSQIVHSVLFGVPYHTLSLCNDTICKPYLIRILHDDCVYLWPFRSVLKDNLISLCAVNIGRLFINSGIMYCQQQPLAWWSLTSYLSHYQGSV